MRSHNIEITPDFNTDKLTRKGPQWLRCKRWSHEGREYKAAYFGDWSRDLNSEWKSWSRESLNGSAAEFDKWHDETKKQERAAREALWDEKRVESTKEFEAGLSEGASPYLHKKGLPLERLFNCRLSNDNYATLFVPARDRHGVIWNYQRIYAKKFDAGDKFFKKGARIDGLYHELTGGRDLQRPDTATQNIRASAAGAAKIFIAEGFATAASIVLALEHIGDNFSRVYCAFTASNLVSVSSEIRACNPDAEIIICADNDAHTLINNKPKNIGVEKAREAAKLISARFTLPPSPAPGQTDFNDLMLKEGVPAVSACMAVSYEPNTFKLPYEIITPGQENNKPEIAQRTPQENNFLLNFTRPKFKVNEKTGKITPPTEKEIADCLIANFYGDNIMREGQNVFIYDADVGHWCECDDRIEAYIKRQINYCAYDQLSSHKLDSAFETFKTYMPHIPPGLSFYTPNPFVANFRDKTVHFNKINNKYVPEIKDHNPKDFLTHVLPFDFPKFQPDGTIEDTPMFTGAICQMFKKDDLETLLAKQRFILELFGTCLAPLYPIIAIFYGKSGTGKSTVIKILDKMLLAKNTSHVKPHEMRGFKLHSMVGKLVNTVLELNTTSPWCDDIMKESIDRSPIDVDRKFKTAVKATMPAIHVFATNQLPQSLDGASGAYGRRAVIIEVTGEPVSDPNLEYADEVWAKESNGIVGQAYLALLDLINQKGAFTRPASSGDLVREFESNSDIIKQFLEAIKEGGVRAFISNAAGSQRIKFDEKSQSTKTEDTMARTDLLGSFYQWCRECGVKEHISRNVFYRRARELGLVEFKDGAGQLRFIGVFAR